MRSSFDLAALPAEGKVRVRAIFARRDNEEGDAPDWSAAKNVILTVSRRTKSVKHGGVNYQAGTIASLTVDDFNWAEYSERDYCGNGEFLIEEWRMQILSVEGV